MKLNKIFKVLPFLISFCLCGVFLLFASRSHAKSWQEVLEKQFDIVETFDNLQDWIGSKRSLVDGYSDDPNDMPKKLDGSSSNWDLYSYWSINEPTDNWIGYHGAEYTLGGEGKSLALCYPDPYDSERNAVKIYPDRMGMYLGNGNPKSGYKKIHLFFMVKFHQGYFPMISPTDFQAVGTLKFLEIASGFREPQQWGTAEEQQQTCNTPQYRNVYGLNFMMLNIANGSIVGSSLVPKEEVDFAEYTTNCGDGKPGYRYNRIIENRKWNDCNFGPQVLANEWIGMEFMFDIGTLGNNDGSTEIWIYDQKGNETGHQVIANYNKLQVFDHLYNKVVIGGNRLGQGYGRDYSDSEENRFYIDDFIINGSRIGPKYFSIKNIPNPPTGLKIVK